MLKIGDFSQLGQVSVRMLRHYDEVGLLPPAHIDQATGYRYYTLEQLPQLNRILALKDMGLSLRKIADLLQKGLPDDNLKQMLNDRRQKLLQQVQDANIQLIRLDARLKQLEQADQPSPYDVILKPLPAHWLGSIRFTVPSLAEMRDARCGAIDELYDWLAHHHITPVGHELLLYHNSEYTETDIDMEVAIATPSPLPEWHTTPQMRVKTRQLCAETQAATTIHSGSIYDLPQAITALFTWLAMNRYTNSGSLREVHLFGRETSKVEHEPVVIELQVPIEPVGYPSENDRQPA